MWLYFSMNTKTYSWLVKIKAIILIAAPRKYFLQFGTPFVFCKPDIAAQNLTPKHQAVHTELNERVKRVNFSLSISRSHTHTLHTLSLSLWWHSDIVHSPLFKENNGLEAWVKTWGENYWTTTNVRNALSNCKNCRKK